VKLIGPDVQWKVQVNGNGDYVLFVRFHPNGDGYWWGVKSWKSEPSESTVNATREIAMQAFCIFGKNISLQPDLFIIENDDSEVARWI